MSSNSTLMIKNLILKGRRKDYIVPFSPGVNIVYGDADTGKSSILRMIYYALGSKRIEVDTEISSSVEYIILELEINGRVYCIRRDLFDPNRMIEVFSNDYSSINDFFPVKYAPYLTHSSKITSISEFLLETLGFPAIQIKQSPSKEDSAFSRLSFLDLFKYCYLDQDEVGSRSLLDSNNFVVATKNREVFKYIFNILDEQISQLTADIAIKTREQSQIEERLRIIGEFLNETKFDSILEIESALDSLTNEEETLNKAIAEINAQITSSNDLYKGFKEALTGIYSQITKLESEKQQAQTNLDRFGRLKNDYINDIEKLKAINAGNDLIGEDKEHHIACPLCESSISVQSIKIRFDVSPEDKINHELNALNRRVRDLEDLIAFNLKIASHAEENLESLYKDRTEASRFLDEQTSNSVTPYLSQRDALISQQAALAERREKFRHEYKVRNQQNSLHIQIGRLATSIDLLKQKLAALQKDMPSFEDIFKDLTTELDNYLKTVNIKNRTGVGVSKRSYLPIVREKEYPNVNSGGLRTILSIGYVSILQAYACDHNINIPNLLMIDTVGKYLGKTMGVYEDDTDTTSDEAEGISDPQKYQNIYEYLIQLSSRFEEAGKHCQIILVDNDVPAEISTQYSGFVVAHYSSDGLHELPIGLIDDWDSFSNKK